MGAAIGKNTSTVDVDSRLVDEGAAKEMVNGKTAEKAADTFDRGVQEMSNNMTTLTTSTADSQARLTEVADRTFQGATEDGHTLSDAASNGMRAAGGAAQTLAGGVGTGAVGTGIGAVTMSVGSAAKGIMQGQGERDKKQAEGQATLEQSRTNSQIAKQQDVRQGARDEVRLEEEQEQHRQNQRARFEERVRRTPEAVAVELTAAQVSAQKGKVRLEIECERLMRHRDTDRRRARILVAVVVDS